jgi:hypothetical protein
MRTVGETPACRQAGRRYESARSVDVFILE